VGKNFNLTVRVMDPLVTQVTAGTYDLTVTPVGSVSGATTGTTSAGEFTFQFKINSGGSTTFLINENSSTLAYATLNVVANEEDSGEGEGGGCATTPRPGPAWLLLALAGALLLSRRRRFAGYETL
jgi:uncharacterized protein (TIGR03382 family)